MDLMWAVQAIQFLKDFLSAVFPFYFFGCIIYIFSSWVPGLRESSFMQAVGMLYEPLMAPFRKIIPPIGGMIDITPIIFLFVVRFFFMGLMMILTWFQNLMI
ncbi:YggT family protein [Aliicoccus persicus]|uniref:YggT family protein n=2 Tax=Aliicoccus persicus TaxID=930138 RepID=A0A662Z229_9STAP|nr:YggT family protein [Aliicoccus persicus]